MQQTTSRKRSLIDNLIWFAGSMLLAFLVWIIATFQSDPILQQRFSQRIPIRLSPDAGLLITAPAASSREASVRILAPSSVFDLLTAEEITVTADLTGLGPGEHTLDLQANIARQQASIVDISPRRLRIVLEEAAQRQIPIRAVVTNEPPAGYSREEPIFDVALNQVLVSGSASKVNEVVAAQVELNLSQQRNPLETDVRLVPVDAEGNAVTDVTLEPQVIRLTLNIRRRDDVREISIRPDIQGTPPEGYVLNSLSYSPQVVLVSGSPSQLAALPDTLVTQAIDLSERTSSFETSVPVVLDDPNLLLLSRQNISVSIEISAVTSSKQFDSIPIEVLGLNNGLQARIAPNQVSVLITGPQAQLSLLEPDDVRVALDLNALAPGNYTISPSVSVVQGQLPGESISILPAEVDVEIYLPATVEATVTP